MKLYTNVYSIHEDTFKSKWFKKVTNAYSIRWVNWYNTHYKTMEEALDDMGKKIETYDPRRYTCVFDREKGTLSVTDMPLPDPIVSFRIGSTAAPCNEGEHLHYTVEKFNSATNTWDPLYMSMNRDEMVEEMRKTARLYKYEADENGVSVNGHGDYEIIEIYSCGYAVDTSYDNLITGIHVVNYYV